MEYNLQFFGGSGAGLATGFKRETITGRPTPKGVIKEPLNEGQYTKMRLANSINAYAINANRPDVQEAIYTETLREYARKIDLLENEKRKLGTSDFRRRVIQQELESAKAERRAFETVTEEGKDPKEVMKQFKRKRR